MVSISTGLDPTKSYVICAIADYGNSVIESNEGNNWKASGPISLKPIVIITSPKGSTNDNTPLLSYTVSDGTVVVKVDGQIVNKVSGDSLALLAEGAHTLRVESTDTTGALGFAESTFTVDTVKPTVSVTSPTAGYTTDNTPLLTYTTSDGTVVVKVDGTVVSKASGSSLDTLADGVHTVTIESTDAAGNLGSASVTFTVDTIPPLVSITSPANGLLTTNRTPQLLYSTSEGTVIVTVDGAVLSKVSGDSLGPLSDGLHQVRVEATDAAGLKGSAEVQFTVDTTPPVIASIDPVNGATNVSLGKTIVVTFSEPVVAGPNLSGVTLKKGKTLVTTTVTVSGNTLLIDPTADLGKAILYTLFIPAGAVKDLVGNQLAAGTTSSFTTSSSTPPAITTTSLSGGTIGVAYNQTLTASGGLTPYNWSIASGSLPAGLTLNPTTGVISGTPAGPAGTSTFTAQVTDATTATATKALSITIAEPSADPDLIVSTVSGPGNGTRGRSVTLTATVTNQGGGGAVASTVTFYLSTDATITSSDIKVADKAVTALAAGGSQTVSVTYTLPTSLAAGKYYVGAIADSGNVLVESNETNNAKAGNQMTVR
jgi:hypothetical protein